MTTPNFDSAYLTYIETAVQECLEFVANLSFDQFFDNRKTRAATVWQICVIGEAANRLSENILQLAPEINWRQLIDMRNILIHQFHNIDYTIVWRVVRDHLPLLITTVHRLRDGLR